jgi:hypothetical protein
MNTKRRAEIASFISELEDIISRAETIRDEEQDAYDNMPESLQSSDRGEQSYSSCDSLSNAVTELESALSSLQDIE